MAIAVGRSDTTVRERVKHMGLALTSRRECVRVARLTAERAGADEAARVAAEAMGAPASVSVYCDPSAEASSSSADASCRAAEANTFAGASSLSSEGLRSAAHECGGPARASYNLSSEAATVAMPRGAATPAIRRAAKLAIPVGPATLTISGAATVAPLSGVAMTGAVMLAPPAAAATLAIPAGAPLRGSSAQPPAGIEANTAGVDPSPATGERIVLHSAVQLVDEGGAGEGWAEWGEGGSDHWDGAVETAGAGCGEGESGYVNDAESLPTSLWACGASRASWNQACSPPGANEPGPPWAVGAVGEDILPHQPGPQAPQYHASCANSQSSKMPAFGASSARPGQVAWADTTCPPPGANEGAVRSWPQTPQYHASCADSPSSKMPALSAGSSQPEQAAWVDTPRPPPGANEGAVRSWPQAPQYHASCADSPSSKMPALGAGSSWPEQAAWADTTRPPPGANEGAVRSWPQAPQYHASCADSPSSKMSALGAGRSWPEQAAWADTTRPQPGAYEGAARVVLGTGAARPATPPYPAAASCQATAGGAAANTDWGGSEVHSTVSLPAARAHLTAPYPLPALRVYIYIYIYI